MGPTAVRGEGGGVPFSEEVECADMSVKTNVLMSGRGAVALRCGCVVRVLVIEWDLWTVYRQRSDGIGGRGQTGEYRTVDGWMGG
jgi:hypothetical protein